MNPLDRLPRRAVRPRPAPARATLLAVLLLCAEAGRAFAVDGPGANQQARDDEKKTTSPGTATALKVAANPEALKKLDRVHLQRLLAEQLEQHAEFIGRDPVLRGFLTERLAELKDAQPEAGVPLDQDEPFLQQLRQAFGQQATPEKVLTYGQLNDLAERYAKAGEWRQELTLYAAMRDLFPDDRTQYFLMTDQIVRVLLAHGEPAEALDQTLRYFARFVRDLSQDRNGSLLFSRLARQALADDDWQTAFQCARLACFFRGVTPPRRDVQPVLQALAPGHEPVLAPPPRDDLKAGDAWLAALAAAWRAVPPLKLRPGALQEIATQAATLTAADRLPAARLAVLRGDGRGALAQLVAGAPPSAAEADLGRRLLVLEAGDPRVFQPTLAPLALPAATATALEAFLNRDPGQRDAELAAWRQAFVDQAAKVAANAKEDLVARLNARLDKREWAAAARLAAQLLQTPGVPYQPPAAFRGETLASLAWLCAWQAFLAARPAGLTAADDPRLLAFYQGFVKHHPAGGLDEFLASPAVQPRTLDDVARLAAALAPARRASDPADLDLLRADVLTAAGRFGDAKATVARYADRAPGPDLLAATATRFRQLARQLPVHEAVQGFVAAQEQEAFANLGEALPALVRQQPLADAGLTPAAVTAPLEARAAALAKTGATDRALTLLLGLLRSGQADEARVVAQMLDAAKAATQPNLVLPGLCALITAYPETQGPAATAAALARLPGNNAAEKADALWRWAEKHTAPATQNQVLLNLMRHLYHERETAAALAVTERFARANPDRQDYARLFRALCHLRLAQPEPATATLTALLQDTPASPYAPQAEYLLALAHLNAGRQDAARPLLTDLVTNHAQTEYGPKARRLLDGLDPAPAPAPAPAP